MEEINEEGEKLLDKYIDEKLAENKLPHCHQIYAEDNKECNSEILIKSLNDEQLLQDYKRALLSDRLNNNSISTTKKTELISWLFWNCSIFKIKNFFKRHRFCLGFPQNNQRLQI